MFKILSTILRQNPTDPDTWFFDEVNEEAFGGEWVTSVDDVEALKGYIINATDDNDGIELVDFIPQAVCNKPEKAVYVLYNGRPHSMYTIVSE